MIIETELLQAIRNRCEIALSEIKLNNQKNELQEIKVLEGFNLPVEESVFKKAQKDLIVPAVIVRPLKGNDIDNDEKFSVKTEIIITIFNDDVKFIGHNDLLLCMNLIRDNIKQDQTLENKFIYDGGFEWQINPEQPYPFWEISLMMNWLVPNTQRTDYNEFI